MKHTVFFTLLTLVSVYAASGQEIIPFPDLSESHIAVYNQTYLIDEKNYSYFTEDYQKALKSVDHEIDAMDKKLETISDPETKKRLETEKEILIKNRLSLLKEADLVEDLHKFY